MATKPKNMTNEELLKYYQSILAASSPTTDDSTSQYEELLKQQATKESSGKDYIAPFAQDIGATLTNLAGVFSKNPSQAKYVSSNAVQEQVGKEAASKQAALKDLFGLSASKAAGATKEKESALKTILELQKQGVEESGTLPLKQAQAEKVKAETEALINAPTSVKKPSLETTALTRMIEDYATGKSKIDPEALKAKLKANPETENLADLVGEKEGFFGSIGSGLKKMFGGTSSEQSPKSSGLAAKEVKISTTPSKSVEKEIPVLSPEGEEGTIPASKLQQALKMGYKKL